MQLFAGSTLEFVDDITIRKLSDRLRVSFFDYYGYQAAHSEVASWESSLAQFALVISKAGLRDNGIIVEMELPQTSKRLDCLVFGTGNEGEANASLVELKQWSSAEEAEPEGCVTTYLGKRLRTVPHPSLQSLRYAEYLQDSVTAYYGDDAIQLRPCSYLHNLDRVSNAALRGERYAPILRASPMFAMADTGELIDTLRRTVGAGRGVKLMERALSAEHKPSKTLLEYTAKMIAGNPVYTLLDEQIFAYETILHEYRRARRAKSDHSVIVVRGGPGTGKSVIALNLVGALSRLGVDVRHATGSKAFTETLWEVLSSRVKPQFRYFNQFGKIAEGAVDVLICDEAHRIRKSSNHRFTKKADRSEIPQVEELIRSAKTTVFFVDDHQAVRPDEIGSSHLIREAAAALGNRYAEVDLYAQFRCAGSDTYLEWLDQLLQVEKSGTDFFRQEDRFEFGVVDTPKALDDKVRELIASGNRARLVAGFCWPWSDPALDGKLVDDIVIGDFRRPWNAKPDAAKLAKGIPKASLWAWSPSGVDQVGCIYTAQGFEFDYVGVIFGLDLVIRNGQWQAQPDFSRDTMLKRAAPEAFAVCVKNIYRVLMSRGLKGCFVTFLDPETREFFEAHFEARA